MNKNLILGVQGLKKMLKSMLFVVGFFAVVGVDAKAGRRGSAAARTAGATTGTITGTGASSAAGTSGTTVVTKKFDTKIDTSKFSQNGKTIVETVEETGEWNPLYNNFLNKMPASPEKTKLEELRDKMMRREGKLVKKEQKTKKKSSIEDTIKSLNSTIIQQNEMIKDLKLSLARERKGVLMSMYETVAGSWKSIGLSGLTGLGTYIIPGIALGGSGAALVAGSVYSLSYGFNYLVSKVKSGEVGDYVAEAIGRNFIMQAMNDGAKYPTYSAKIDGLNKDILNTSEMDDETFGEYRKNTLNDIIQEQKDKYEAIAKLEGVEQKIDKEIINVRNKYFKDNMSLLDYADAIAKGENIEYAQAVISEYLRANFRNEQQELSKEVDIEKKDKAKEEKSYFEQFKNWYFLDKK